MTTPIPATGEACPTARKLLTPEERAAVERGVRAALSELFGPGGRLRRAAAYDAALAGVPVRPSRAELVVIPPDMAAD
jgi:hypothetical protein